MTLGFTVFLGVMCDALIVIFPILLVVFVLLLIWDWFTEKGVEPE